MSERNNVPDQLTTNTSETVLLVLREAIGSETISLTDDFYLAGGHSLLIVRIIQRLRKQFAIDLPIRQFGVNSQIAALVAACRPSTTE